MISFKLANKKIENNIILLIFLNIYLFLYAIDVYGISLPFDPALGRTLIFYIIFAYTIGKVIFRPQINMLEIALILYSFIVVVGQFVNGLFTFSKAANDLFFPLILFAFTRFFYGNNEKKIQKAIVCESAFLILFFSLFIYASFSMKLRYGMYLNSSYYCALLLPFVLCISKTWVRNILILLCLIPSVLSFKRGAYLSVILGVIIYFIAIRKSDDFKSNKKKYVIWGIAAAAGIAIVMIYMNQRLNINMIERLMAVSDDGGAGRIDLIKGMLSLLSNNSAKGFIIGHGSFTSSKYLGSSSHNDFLEMLWSYGILGFISYLFILLFLFRKCKELKKNNDDYYAPCLVAIVQFIVCSMVSQLVFVPTYVAFLLVFFSMVSFIPQKQSGNKQTAYIR